jgi:hypothetical protein
MVKKILIISLFFVFIMMISSSYTSASVSESSCKVESSSYIIDEDYYYKSDNGPYALVIGRARVRVLPFLGVSGVYIDAYCDGNHLVGAVTNSLGFYKLWVPVEWFGVMIDLYACDIYTNEYPESHIFMKPWRLYYCCFNFNLINWGS